MKKQGFTLAEVLITLTIIGVVAVLTLPALMTNTQEQQARTALGKMTSTMTNIAALSSAKDGIDYTGITAQSKTEDLGTDTTDHPSLLNLIANNATINRNADVISVTNGPVSLDMKAVFNDGTAVYFPSNTLSEDVSAMQTDGLPRGFVVVFDTNGDKGPNQISNCVTSGTSAGITTASGDDDGDCANKKDRYLKDRYLMALRGTKVDPIGAASVYMMTGGTGTVAKINTSGGDPANASE